MNKPMNIRIVCELPLRDYASLEELLDGAGVTVLDHELVTAPAVEAEPPAEHASKAWYRKTTQKDLARLRAYVRENPNTTQMGAARALGFPFASGTMSQMFKKIRIQKAVEAGLKKPTDKDGEAA